MATGAISKPRIEVKESVFHWEGRDKNGRVIKGEMRAGGESVVAGGGTPAASKGASPGTCPRVS